MSEQHVYLPYYEGLKLRTCKSYHCPDVGPSYVDFRSFLASVHYRCSQLFVAPLSVPTPRIQFYNFTVLYGTRSFGWNAFRYMYNFADNRNVCCAKYGLTLYWRCVRVELALSSTISAAQ